MSDLINRADVLALAKDIVGPTANGEYRYRCIDPQEVIELQPAQPRPDVDGILDITVQDYTMVNNIVLREPDGEYAVIFERPKRSHGMWIEKPRCANDKQPDMVCPYCGNEVDWFGMTKFCGECGADMRWV